MAKAKRACAGQCRASCENDGDAAKVDPDGGHFDAGTCNSATTTVAAPNSANACPPPNRTRPNVGSSCEPCGAPRPPPASVRRFAKRTNHPAPRESGVCAYTTRIHLCDNCVDSVDGGPVRGDVCQGCLTPPAPTCVGSVKRVFASPGTCQEPVARRLKTPTPVRLLEGQLPVDPCRFGLHVTADGDVRRRHHEAGVPEPRHCTAGTCAYSTQDVTCANGCSNGQCQGDPCAGVSCNAPPPPTCANATTQRVFTDGGTCSAGDCGGYPFQDVGCNSPPPASCTGGVLTTHSATGACSQGSCSYAPSTSSCTFGCNAAGNACAPDPCLGVNCSATPASTCANGSTRRVYTGGGTCTAGTCGGYPYTDVACNAPPAPACVGGSLTTYSPSGSCSGGKCSYTPMTMSCPFGCNSGGDGCAADPCAGVSCTTPTATCANGTTRRQYTGPGTCSAGTCGPAPYQDTTCPTPTPVCAAATVKRVYNSGTCSGAGVCSNTFGDTDCSTAPVPNPTCAGTNSVRVYEAGTGTCTSGACTWSSHTVTCQSGYSCLAGMCTCTLCLVK